MDYDLNPPGAMTDHPESLNSFYVKIDPPTATFSSDSGHTPPPSNLNPTSHRTSRRHSHQPIAERHSSSVTPTNSVHKSKRSSHHTAGGSGGGDRGSVSGHGSLHRRDRERQLANTPRDTLIQLVVAKEHEGRENKSLLQTTLLQLDLHTKRLTLSEAKVRELERKARAEEETRTKEGLGRTKALLDAQKDAREAREQISALKLQIDNLERELQRANHLASVFEKERNDAEARLIEARTTARQFKKQTLVLQAREEGRQEGYQEGLRQGRMLHGLPSTAASNIGGFLQPQPINPSQRQQNTSVESSKKASSSKRHDEDAEASIRAIAEAEQLRLARQLKAAERDLDAERQKSKDLERERDKLSLERREQQQSAGLQERERQLERERMQHEFETAMSRERDRLWQEVQRERAKLDDEKRRLQDEKRRMQEALEVKEDALDRERLALDAARSKTLEKDEERERELERERDRIEREREALANVTAVVTEAVTAAKESAKAAEMAATSAAASAAAGSRAPSLAPSITSPKPPSTGRLPYIPMPAPPVPMPSLLQNQVPGFSTITTPSFSMPDAVVLPNIPSMNVPNADPNLPPASSYPGMSLGRAAPAGGPSSITSPSASMPAPSIPNIVGASSITSPSFGIPTPSVPTSFAPGVTSTPGPGMSSLASPSYNMPAASVPQFGMSHPDHGGSSITAPSFSMPEPGRPGTATPGPGAFSITAPSFNMPTPGVGGRPGTTTPGPGASSMTTPSFNMPTPGGGRPSTTTPGPGTSSITSPSYPMPTPGSRPNTTTPGPGPSSMTSPSISMPAPGMTSSISNAGPSSMTSPSLSMPAPTVNMVPPPQPRAPSAGSNPYSRNPTHSKRRSSGSSTASTVPLDMLQFPEPGSRGQWDRDLSDIPEDASVSAMTPQPGRGGQGRGGMMPVPTVAGREIDSGAGSGMSDSGWGHDQPSTDNRAGTKPFVPPDVHDNNFLSPYGNPGQGNQSGLRRNTSSSSHNSSTYDINVVPPSRPPSSLYQQEGEDPHNAYLTPNSRPAPLPVLQPVPPIPIPAPKYGRPQSRAGSHTPGRSSDAPLPVLGRVVPSPRVNNSRDVPTVPNTPVLGGASSGLPEGFVAQSFTDKRGYTTPLWGNSNLPGGGDVHPPVIPGVATSSGSTKSKYGNPLKGKKDDPPPVQPSSVFGGGASAWGGASPAMGGRSPLPGRSPALGGTSTLAPDAGSRMPMPTVPGGGGVASSNPSSTPKMNPVGIYAPPLVGPSTTMQMGSTFPHGEMPSTAFMDSKIVSGRRDFDDHDDGRDVFDAETQTNTYINAMNLGAFGSGSSPAGGAQPSVFGNLGGGGGSVFGGIGVGGGGMGSAVHSPVVPTSTITAPAVEMPEPTIPNVVPTTTIKKKKGKKK